MRLGCMIGVRAMSPTSVTGWRFRAFPCCRSLSFVSSIDRDPPRRRSHHFASLHCTSLHCTSRKRACEHNPRVEAAAARTAHFFEPCTIATRVSAWCCSGLPWCRCGMGRAQSWCRCGMGREPSPGADVGWGESPFLVQMWDGARAHSRCRCGMGREPIPDAEVGWGESPFPVQMWDGASPVLVQMWDGVGPLVALFSAPSTGTRSLRSKGVRSRRREPGSSLTHARAHTRTLTHTTHAHILTHSRTPIHTHARAHARTRSHTHAHMRSHTHAHTRAGAHTRARTLPPPSLRILPHRLPPALVRTCHL
jgi:hypothetical protein